MKEIQGIGESVIGGVQRAKNPTSIEDPESKITHSLEVVPILGHYLTSTVDVNTFALPVMDVLILPSCASSPTSIMESTIL